MNERVEKTMSKNIITVSNAASLEAAYKIMLDKNIRHLPVVNEEGLLCGILSDRDIQRAMTSEIKEGLGIKMESVSFNPNSRVCDYMTWPAKSVTHEATLSEVTDKMLKDRVSAYLIENEEGIIVGIVTTDDLLRALRDLAREKPGVTAKLRDLLSSGFFGRLGQMASDIGL